MLKQMIISEPWTDIPHPKPVIDIQCVFTYAGDLCALSIQQGLHGLDNQKKCHAGKYEQDSMEKQAPFKKARTGNPHVKVCKGSATCKETSL